MYTEEPRREINWGNLIKKGLLIILVAAIIFLVIWLFTRNNSNGVNVNYDGNNNSNTTETNKDSNTYSEIFIDNYRYFHDTAKEYFLISNLPEKGKTLKFTLQELIDKKLIIPFSYTNTESCDTEASYVSVKNTDGKYEMTTTLVCGTEIATTKEELGCNQICVNNIDCDCNCTGTTDTEKVTEYQYKQAYIAKENVYTCPTGYTKTGSGSNTKCVKTDSSSIKATKTVEYLCKEGYTKVGTGSSATCVKGSEEKINATKNVTYNCPSGYLKSGSGSNTKCYKYTEDKVKADYEYDYSCSSGYTLKGNKCVKASSTTVNATPNISYNCPTGYTLNGNKCVKASTSTIDATPNISYNCPSGYSKSGSSCIKYLYTIISYGPTYNGCTGGQLVKSACTSSGCISSRYVYKCTQGVSSATTYSCPTGYTLNGTKCVKASTSTINATPTTTYSCEEGKVSNDKCIINYTITVPADKDKVYYCSDDDYVLDGSYCYKTDKTTIKATQTTTYTCKDGYTKTGSGSNTKCTISNKEEIKTYKNTSYTCDKGYTKIGNGSSAVCTKGTTTTVNPTVTTKEVTKYTYKWSTQESLAGWEKTGKTRQTNASSK